jgi:5-methylcytosine-specific restriction endonuclease McrA
MAKKRKKREYEDEDVVDLSGYPPWLKIFIALIIAFVFITAFVPGWILYTVIAILVVSFVGISYWLYTKKGINVPKESVKTIYEGYKKLDEDWKKQQEVEWKKTQEEAKERTKHGETVPPLSTKEKEIIIRKVGTRCWYPGCKETIALDVHHIIQRSEGGPNKENNLVVLCPTHHRLARDGTIPNVKKIREIS